MTRKKANPQKRPNQLNQRAVNADLTQGSDEWFKARRGKLTASRIGKIMPGKRGAYLKPREQLMDEMFVELLGDNVEKEKTPHQLQRMFDWGNNNESGARIAYQVNTGKLVREVGLWDHPAKLDDNDEEVFPYCHLAASPDGILVLEPVGLEIKCPWGNKNHDLLLDLVEQGVPTEDPAFVERISEDYRWQMVLQMECAELERVDFVSFDPRRPERERVIIVPFQRPEGFSKMYVEAEKFLNELHKRVQQRKDFRNEHTKI